MPSTSVRLWHDIEMLDNKAPAALQYDMMLGSGRLVERATLWLLQSGVSLDLRERVAQLAPGIAALDARLGEILPAPEAGALAARIAAYVERGAPPPLAARVARLEQLVSAADIVRLAEAARLDIVEVGRAYFAVGARFALDALRAAAQKLRPRRHGRRWR